MWAKSIKNGMSSKFIRVFQSLYDKMKLEVKNSPNQDTFSSNVGILQGEISSPLFFSFFVNDIESRFDNDSTGIYIYDMLLKILMYADDMAIFSTTKEGLQESLNSLSIYCEKWDISVNVR